MNDIMILVISGVSAALLIYWFWPGKALCKACGSELDVHNFCYCTNLTCRYVARQQEV